jgi:hypothetical protein
MTTLHFSIVAQLLLGVVALEVAASLRLLQPLAAI